MKTLFNRRDFISGSAGAMVGGSLLGTDSVAAGKPINLRLATFRFGHEQAPSSCGNSRVLQRVVLP